MQSFVILWISGPQWVEGAPVYEQPFIKKHADHIGRLMSEQQVVLSGPFAASVGSRSSPAGMTVITAVDEEHVRAWVADDPLIAHRVATAEVYPFQIVFAAQGASTGADCVSP